MIARIGRGSSRLGSALPISLMMLGCGDADQRPGQPVAPAAVERPDAAGAGPVAWEETVAEADDLARLVASAPGSSELRARFLLAFDNAFNTPPRQDEPHRKTVPGNALIQAQRFAREGDPSSLTALMRAALGWYGATGEGGEWLNELLWETLEVQPQLTLTTLARLPPDLRSDLVDGIYTMPLHDEFDFEAIVEGLRAADVPPELEAAVARMIATAEDHDTGG